MMSNVTTDYETWYEAHEPEDQQDKDDLVQSVETLAEIGNYISEERNGQFFVSCGAGGEQLRLASVKAKASFLNFLKKAKVLDDIDLDFDRAVKDPKS